MPFNSFPNVGGNGEMGDPAEVLEFEELTGRVRDLQKKEELEEDKKKKKKDE